MTSSENRSPTRARTASPSAGAQSTSARRGEIGYQTIPSPSIGLAGGTHLELRQVRDVGDADGGVVFLAGDRDRDEPAVALLERGAEVALRALDRRPRDRVDAAAVGGSVDGEEREAAHDFTFSPAGS